MGVSAKPRLRAMPGEMSSIVKNEDQSMKPRLMIPVFIVSILVAPVLLGPAPKAAAETARGGTAAHYLVQHGQRVTGFFKKIDTKKRTWTVTIESMDHSRKRTCQLSATPAITYRGEFVPWQQGVIIDSIVELIMEGGEVTTINVLEWAS